MANYTQSGYDPSLHGYWKGTIDGADNYGYPANYFYADTIRSLMIGFENFFNEIKVVRYDKQKCPQKVIDVPIKFGPRQKSHDFRVEQETGKKYYISLPNLTYKIDSMEFDAERAKGIYQERAFYSKFLEDAGLTGDMHDRFWSDTQPTPYNVNVTMDANCEKMSDALQIVEQIGARFNPACFINLKEFWFFNMRRSIKMILNSTTWDVQSDSMGEEEWRQIKVTFSFKLEAILYKPVKDAQIIEKINTYLTLDKENYMYHAALFGNADGSVSGHHNFSKVYGTKVDKAYVLDGEPVTSYDPEISAYTTRYSYKQTDELTTYGKDAKLLVRTVTRWIPSGLSAEGEYAVHYGRPLYGPSAEISGGWHGASSMAPITGYEKSTTYTNEWMTTNEYVPLSGYGQLRDQTVEFGTKTETDQYGSPYPAYWSRYSEEGAYTDSPKVYASGGADFLYKKIDDPRYEAVLFSGSKYSG